MTQADSPPKLEEAIVLRRIPYGDSSVVVHLFSEARGRVAMLVKGAFRPKSPFFGGLDLLDRIAVEVLARKETSLALPGAFAFSAGHRRLRARLPALTAALYAAELVDAVLTEAPQPRLYGRLRDWLAALDAEMLPAPQDLAAGCLRFELGLLEDLGLQPSFDRCAECGRALGGAAGALAVSVRAGGLLCEHCRVRIPAESSLSRAARELGAGMAAGEAPPAPPAAAIRELRAFLDRFLKFHLDYLPKSRAALELLWH